MKRLPLIVANWKMHKTAKETADFVTQLKSDVPHPHAGIWLAVPFTFLNIAKECAADSPIEIGAQNVSDQMEGALTGEISALMLKDIGAGFVIIGHSERRRHFFEDDALINRKIIRALEANLQVILCIGETKEERESGKTASILTQQLDKGLKGIGRDLAPSIIFAYEPVWAIGSKLPASIEMVEEIHSICKNHIANYWGLQANLCRVLYGGSVNPENAREFLMHPNVDGLLVGTAALNVESFVKIIHQAH